MGFSVLCIIKEIPLICTKFTFQNQHLTYVLQFCTLSQRVQNYKTLLERIHQQKWLLSPISLTSRKIRSWSIVTDKAWGFTNGTCFRLRSHFTTSGWRSILPIGHCSVQSDYTPLDTIIWDFVMLIYGCVMLIYGHVMYVNLNDSETGVSTCLITSSIIKTFFINTLQTGYNFSI